MTKLIFFRAELLPEGIRGEYFCTQIYFIVWTWMYIHFYNALIALWNSFIYKAWMHLILVFRKITFPRKYLVILVTLKLQTYLKIQNLKEKKVGLKMTPPPFWTIPKIHPFLWHHLSLKQSNMSGLLSIWIPRLFFSQKAHILLQYWPNAFTPIHI